MRVGIPALCRAEARPTTTRMLVGRVLSRQFWLPAIAAPHLTRHSRASGNPGIYSPVCDGAGKAMEVMDSRLRGNDKTFLAPRLMPLGGGLFTAALGGCCGWGGHIQRRGEFAIAGEEEGDAGGVIFAAFIGVGGIHGAV